MAKKKMTLEEIIKKMHETCPEDNEDSTWEECFKYCLMGAELGSGECMANTAFCYEYGNGVEEDQDKAVEWAQKGADAGNAVAMCHLARYYDSGNGVDADAKLAFKYFKMSAEKGYSQAIGTLGCFYAEGDVVEQDYKKAFECWKKAADDGYDYHAADVAECYLYGKGVEKNIKLARKYADLAPENNECDQDILDDLENAEKELATQKEKVEEEQIELPKEIKKLILPGREKLNKYFNEEIIDFFRHQKEYEEMGIHNVPATLLYGPPGCGKTYAVQQVAKCLNMPVFEINSSTVGDSYIHGTAKKIAKLFKKAKEQAPSIVIMDEMETYVGKRDDEKWASRVEETNEMLRSIPDAIDNKVVVFGMTNHLDMIDKAVLRTGRFDNQIEVGPATAEEIAKVFKAELAKTKFAPKLQIKKLAEKMVGRPLSDVTYVVRQGIRSAVRSGRKQVEQKDLEKGLTELCEAHKLQQKKSHKIGFETA